MLPRSHFLLSPSRRLSELGESIWTHAHALGEGAGLLTIYELQTADAMKGTGQRKATRNILFQPAPALLPLAAAGRSSLRAPTAATALFAGCPPHHAHSPCPHSPLLLGCARCFFFVCVAPLFSLSAFFGVDATLLLGAVRWLESRGRCAVIPSPVVAETGVKMLG